MKRLTKWGCALTALATLPFVARGQSGAHATGVDWTQASGDQGAMRYSPLTDVSRANVARLTIAWTWKTGEQPIAASAGQKAVRPGQFQASPVVIHDTMYVATPYAGVAALDAATGRQLWRYDSEAWKGASLRTEQGWYTAGSESGAGMANDASSSMRDGASSHSTRGRENPYRRLGRTAK